MNETTLVVYRVSRKDSTTKNQKYALDAWVKEQPTPPRVLDIQDSNWLRPIPAMLQLMREVKARRWKQIIVYRTDRLGRRPEFDTELWYACKKNGCILHILEPDLRSDRDEDETKFLRQVADARDEQLLISKRVRLAIEVIRDEVKRGICDWRWVGRKKGAIGKKTTQDMEMIVSALKGGLSVRKVALGMGYSEDTIRKIRDENGIPRLRPDATPPPAAKKSR